MRERKLPKLYWADPGIVRSVRRRFGDLSPEEHGALFEGLVAQLIRAHKSYGEVCDESYYWAPLESASVEVDFLLAREDRFVAVEVRSGRRFHEGWCRGLRAIGELEGLCRRMVVYPEGPRMRTADGIEVMPFTEFAALLAAGELWP